MNRRVLVTGSSRGIGRAIALELAREGFDIAVHCKGNTGAALQAIAEIEQLGRKCSLLQFDVTDRAVVREQIEEDMKSNGAYYGVVSNAGIAQDGPFPGLTGEAWDSVINTNLHSFYNVLNPVIMPMLQEKRGGRIVTISSISGITGNRGQVNYSAAKAGIIGATKALAQELAKRNVTVNCVAPGLIETDMIEKLSEEHRESITKMIPLRRLGRVEDVAGPVSFLFSAKADYITGQVISVNGGMI